MKDLAKPTKLLFLDVDGVLNNLSDFQEAEKLGNKSTLIVDSFKVERLKKIIDATNATIILSSTWRLFEDHLSFIQDKLKEFNLTIFDVTPKLKTFRGFEIEKFMMVRKLNFSKTKILILDDVDEMLGWQEKSFIKTSWKLGLQDKHILEAIEILNK